MQVFEPTHYAVRLTTEEKEKIAQAEDVLWVIIQEMNKRHREALIGGADNEIEISQCDLETTFSTLRDLGGAIHTMW